MKGTKGGAPEGNQNAAKVKGERRVMVSIRLSGLTVALMKDYAKANGKEITEVLESAIIEYCS